MLNLLKKAKGYGTVHELPVNKGNMDSCYVQQAGPKLITYVGTMH